MTSFSKGIRPFRDFYDDLHRRSAPRVAGAPNVAEARAYLVDHYAGVQPAASFVDSLGRVYDCIPFEQQAGVRGAADTSIPVAPDLPQLGDVEAPPGIQRSVKQELGTQSRDQFGNQMVAPAGTVPIRRVSVDEIVQQGSLDDFISGGKVKPLLGYDVAASDGAYHRYATGRTFVASHGVHTKASVHKNSITWNGAVQQIFSLQQVWVSHTDPGTGYAQTIEVVIMSYPARAGGSQDPIIVVFTTRNNYGAGGTAYNTNSGFFVQTNSNWMLDGKLGPYCVNGGNQYYLTIAIKLDPSAAKWWVYLGGETSQDALGYYPTSFFSSQVTNGLAVQSNRLSFGGETTVNSTEPATFPPMGSGNHANAGWKQAAYMRDVRLYPTTGGTAMLTTGSTSSWTGYSAKASRYSSPWNETLWYGGPGGT